MDETNQLLEMWLEAKEFEQKAKERRALYEQKIFASFGMNGIHETDCYNLKITPSIVRKVSNPQDLMKSLREQQMANIATECFAWEAKPKMQEIKKQPAHVQEILMSFIDTKENKPSISITQIGA